MPRGMTTEAPRNLPKLAAPARRALAGAGIMSLKDLSDCPEAAIAGLHGMGPKAMRTLRAALDAQGLAFRTAG